MLSFSDVIRARNKLIEVSSFLHVLSHNDQEHIGIVYDNNKATGRQGRNNVPEHLFLFWLVICSLCTVVFQVIGKGGAVVFVSQALKYVVFAEHLLITAGEHENQCRTDIDNEQ